MNGTVRRELLKLVRRFNFELLPTRTLRSGGTSADGTDAIPPFTDRMACVALAIALTFEDNALLDPTKRQRKKGK